MNFSFLSSGLVLLGFIGLALGLFFLQRLRVRYRPVVVETTLFWREALHEARARVLVKRFRHPWPYLLILSILTLIWLGMAGPEFNRDRARRHLVLVDGSDLMADGDRFLKAISLAEDALSFLPTDSRTVVLAAETPRTLLRPGENAVLLRARLKDYAPKATRLSLEEQINTFLAEDRETPLGLIVVGDAELDQAFLEQLPPQSTWRRLRPKAQKERTDLVSLGQGAARSGRHDCVDVLIRVRGPALERDQFRVILAGRELDQLPLVEEGADETEFRYLDIAARGEVFALDWPSSARDELRLADNRALSVLVAAELPKALTRAIESDPGLQVVTTGGDLVLRPAGSRVGGDLPSLELGSKEVDSEAFYFQHDEDLQSQDILQALVDELGLSSLDGPALAASVGATLRIGAGPGPRRQMRLWSELFEEERGFVTTAEFPVFIGRSLRWLANRSAAESRVAVGESIPVHGLVRGPGDFAQSSLNDDFRPTLPGRYEDKSGREFAASNQELARAGSVAVMPTDEGDSSRGIQALDFILLLALFLLALEWFLVRMGRMP